MVIARSKTGYQVEIEAGRHRFLADEPLGVGDDAGPAPYDLLLSSLAACKIMTVQMYARRKDWPLEAVEVQLRADKIHARDCEDCESSPDSQVDVIYAKLSFHGDLTPAQIERLGQIADRCPVHRTLTSETKVRTTIREHLPAFAPV